MIIIATDGYIFKSGRMSVKIDQRSTKVKNRKFSKKFTK